VKTIGLGCFLWFIMGAVAFGSVPARLEYQGYLTDAVGTPIDCQSCDTPYTFKFSIFDEQADGTLLWSEVHAGTDVVQGVFRVELGLGESLDAELLEDNRWLEIQINDQPPLVPRQRIISVPYALRASVAEHAIESENAASLGGHPVENFVQVDDTTGYLQEADLADVLTDLGYVPGDNDSLADINTCAADEILRWDGSAWICGVDQNSDPLSTLLCASGEIAQWDGSTWGCSAALDVLQANIDQVQANVEQAQTQVQANVDQVQVNVDQVQANVDALDASLDPVAKTGLPADLADGDDNTQRTEAEVLSMVSGAGYVTGDHFSGAWGDLSGVPADILDGDADTDTLATLGCATKQVPEWNGSAWTCGTGAQWTDDGTRLTANNAPNVVVTDTGRVGIGTPDPTEPLHVKGSIRAGNRIDIYEGTDTTRVGILGAWNDLGGGSVPNNNDLVIKASSDLGISFAPNNGGSAAYISSSGDVGIGTTSPATTLDVIGIGSFAGAEASLSQGNVQVGVDSGGDPGGELMYHTDDYVGIRCADSGALSLAVKPDGKVGIGTTNPVTRLDVAGGVKVGASSICDASTAGTIRWTGTAIEGCNGVTWANLGGNAVPASVMFIENDQNNDPEPCPSGWTEVQMRPIHQGGGHWGYRRTCWTGKACTVLFIENDQNNDPESCPSGWTEVQMRPIHQGGGHWGYRRTCFTCN